MTELNLTFGRTLDELSAAFDLVKNRENWKNPINRVVGRNVDRELLRDAIIFYTGSVPTFTLHPAGLEVRADGYYIAVGA